MLGSKKNEQNLYTAIPSFLISPSVAQATDELSATLDRTLTDLSAQYQVKFNDRTALNKEYKSVQSGSVTFAGRNYRSGETDVDGTLQKAKADQDKKAAEVRKHNEELKQRQSELETEATAIAVKKLRVKALLTIIQEAAHRPLLYDAAAMLVSRSPEEQLIALSVLTKGAAVSFGDGYITKDIRLVSALMDNPSERIELIK
jgi:hypothetical protein